VRPLRGGGQKKIEGNVTSKTDRVRGKREPKEEITGKYVFLGGRQRRRGEKGADEPSTRRRIEDSYKKGGGRGKESPGGRATSRNKEVNSGSLLNCREKVGEAALGGKKNIQGGRGSGQEVGKKMRGVPNFLSKGKREKSYKSVEAGKRRRSVSRRGKD